MSEWLIGKLGDIADIVMGQSPIGESVNTDGLGTPLLNGPTEFTIRYPEAVQFTIDPKRFSQTNDILFCVRGSTTGRMNWADQDYAIGRGLAAIRHKKGKEYRYFVKAILDYYLDTMLASASGSTFPNVSKDQLNELEISYPPLHEQKAIASVLSSLDDKIDLLHRQNKTLEAMAETLFRQWFIEEAKEDWEETKVLEIFSLVGGGTPKTSEPDYWDGDIPWLSGGDIANAHQGFIVSAEKAITDLGLEKSSAKLLPQFASVISARGTVGKYAMLSRPMTFSQSNYGILPKGHNHYCFTYLLLAYIVDELSAAAYGSVFDTITTRTFEDVSLKLPPIETLKEFEFQVGKLFEKKLNNVNQVQTLEKLRDTLLPKLMSGEVRVQVKEEKVA